MQITSIIINSKNNNKKNHLPSFYAMKKADFRGIDFAIVEKFKAPIETFDVLADFQNWAGCIVEKIKNTNYLGRQLETIVQRKGILQDWFNYVIEENGAYTKAIQLLILSAITKNLGKKDDNLPPTMNKGVLTDCVSDLNKELEKDKKAKFDFSKMYQNKLRVFYSDDTKTGESETKWVVIPSKKHDLENFEANVEKLKTLSYKSWCTKSYNAEPYLSEGDFHVYLENGEPKIGIRFVGNKIQEIQGERNDSQIPLKYFDLVNDYVGKNNFNYSNDTKEELKRAKINKLKFEKIKQDLSDTIENNDVVKIYEYFGINVEKDKNSKLILSEYKQPSCDFTYNDLGIDEQKLFNDVIRIKGNACFANSQLKTLGILERIDGDADFSYSKFIDLGKLSYIGKNATFLHSQVKKLGNLRFIGENVLFGNSFLLKFKDQDNYDRLVQEWCSNVIDLGNLEYIGGYADCVYAQFTSLGNVRYIGGNVLFNFSNVVSLGKLENVGKNIYLRYSRLKVSDFKDIKVSGSIYK